MSRTNWQNRTLFHGDNLDFLRAMNSASVDLIATDPPFNKGRDFHATPDSLASGAKFQDRWSWERDVHEEWTDQIKDDYPRLMEAIESARYAHSDGMGAFMCFMAVRLLAMRRVLKPAGSIYLHCDPTASHYLKAIMDAVFGQDAFRNEIVWKRTPAKALMSRRLPSNHDVILFYQAGERPKWNADAIFVPYDPDNLDERTAVKYRHRDPNGRIYRLDNLINPNRDRPNLTYEFLGVTRVWRWTRERMEAAYEAGLVVQRKPGGVPQLKRYLDEQKGRPLGDVWTDIPPINSQAKERIGYPTQKPLELYERIIKASSNEGDMVLDPFCGCATTLVAAERLKRQWVGIDIWDEAHETVIRRLQSEGLEGPDGSLGEALPLYGKIHYFKEQPERTDSGETATIALETINRRELAAWQKLSHQQMVAILKESQADADDKSLVICAGCGRKLEPEFMELDHITPRSEPHSTNDLSNRILLCRPCNGRKSNKLAMTGLRNENKKAGWMMDEERSKQAVTMAYNAYRREQRKDG